MLDGVERIGREIVERRERGILKISNKKGGGGAGRKKIVRIVFPNFESNLLFWVSR